MKVVTVRDLKEIKLYDYGKYSWVKLIELDGVKYCYKQFRLMYDDETVISRFCDFTDINYPHYLLMPLYMVETENLFSGYLTRYDEKLVDIDDPFTFDEQLRLIKSAKNHLNIFHNEFNLIHGDMHFSNIKCHRKKIESFLLDFDFSYPIGCCPNSLNDFGIPVKNYLNYYSFDKNIDIYYFNLATFLFLTKINATYDIVLSRINDNDYALKNENNDVKRLVKELTLEDTRKPYSGEYIIDYIV